MFIFVCVIVFYRHNVSFPDVSVIRFMRDFVIKVTESELIFDLNRMKLNPGYEGN